MASDLKLLRVAVFDRKGKAVTAPLSNIVKYLLTGFAIVILGACTKAPTCADEENFGLIKQIYQESFDKRTANLPERVKQILQVRFKDYPLTIESIMDEGRNTETGRQTCSADLVIVLPTKVVESAQDSISNRTLIRLGLNQKSDVKIDGNRYKMHVNYVLQRTADTKVLTITMEDLHPLAHLIIDFAGSSSYILIKEENALVASLEPPSAGEIALIQASPDMSIITQYIGKQPSEALADKFIETKFKALLTINYNTFAENLSVASALQEEGDFLYGSGNAPSGNGSDEAGFAIHKKSGAIYAVMLVDGKDVKWFGSGAVKDFPAPLRKWLSNKGVSN